MNAWRQSLTFRLVSLFVAVIALLLIGLGWLTMASTDRHFLELDEIYLRDKGVLVREIGSHSLAVDDLVSRIRQMLSTQTGLNVALFQNGQIIYSSQGFSLPDTVRTGMLSDVSSAVFQWQVNDQSLRGIAVDVLLPTEGNGTTVNAVLALDTEHHDHFMDSFRWLTWLYVGLGILVGGLLAWWAARKGLHPLRPIIQKTRHMSASQLSDRIPINEMPLELQPLTQTLNNMLARLEQDFSRLSAFSSDLAHELRTPISNMLVQTQVTLGKPRGLEQYQEALLSMVEELERLSHMVSDMLYLAKTEHQVELPRHENVDLGLQASELADFYQLMADDKKITISVTGQGSIHGDRGMVRRAISNLLSNAIRHARASTCVSINIQEDSGQVRLTVSNEGDPIAHEDIPRIFDRFYRAEKARTNPGTDGAGLGLAITRAIMMAHNGQIEVASAQGKTVFQLIFVKPRHSFH
ncbi:MAG: heavy metal sensor histidine kinase [Burkholderiaceae bacterium]|nr:heavy metal sensor histidine kinase [Burkholderiaceae bacterium]